MTNRGPLQRVGSHSGNVALRASKRTAAAVLACALVAPSVAGSRAVKGRRWAWPEGARVSVRLSSDFSIADGSFAAVVSAFRSWERAGRQSGNGSGVTFRFGDAPAHYEYHVAYGRVVDGGQAHTLMLSAPGGLFVAWTTIDPRVKEPVALSHVMAHEIGHTFGLAECDACATGSSVMTRYTGDFNDVVSGRNAPSDDDNAAVRLNGGYGDRRP